MQEKSNTGTKLAVAYFDQMREQLDEESDTGGYH